MIKEIKGEDIIEIGNKKKSCQQRIVDDLNEAFQNNITIFYFEGYDDLTPEHFKYSFKRALKTFAENLITSGFTSNNFYDTYFDCRAEIKLERGRILNKRVFYCKFDIERFNKCLKAKHFYVTEDEYDT